MHVYKAEGEKSVSLWANACPIADLEFSKAKSEYIVGCVDQVGNIFVAEVFESTVDPKGLESKILLEIAVGGCANRPTMYHRLSWCPFVPAKEEKNENDDRFYKVFTVVRNTVVDVYYIEEVVEAYGSTKRLINDEVKTGRFQLSNLPDQVVVAKLSPDGLALATASEAGTIRLVVFLRIGTCMYPNKS